MQIITKSRLCGLLILFFIGGIAAAQTTEGFSYQSILRDNSGNPIQQQNVTVDITISEQSANGTTVYQESHSVTTSDIGLISIVIGNGTPISGNFQNIDWSSAPHFVTSSSTPAGGTAITGSSQLLSVPYAKFAAVSGSSQARNGWGLNGNDIDENLDYLGSNNNQDVQIRRNNETVAIFQETNVALGRNAYINGTGNSNVAIGNNSLANTSGQFNVAIGDNTMVNTTTGEHNIGLGFVALNQNTTGNENIGLGNNALTNNTTGDRNIALGAVSLFNNTTGERNIALGGDALNQNTTGSENIAIGQSALNQMNNGFVNVAVGVRALEQNTSGNENIAIGLEAMRNSQGTRQIGIGVNALANASASSTVNYAIGNEALQNLTDGIENLAIGQNAMGASTNAGQNIAIGHAALETITDQTNNIAIGIGAMRNSTGATNVAIGNGALENSAAGVNIGIGGNALNTVQSNQNIAIGLFTLQNYTDPTMFGRNAMVGFASGSSLSIGTLNSSLGQISLQALIVGSKNAALGAFTGSNLISGSDNTLLGTFAGRNISNGDNNIFIGSETIVGTDATVTADVSNQLNIGNSIYGDLSTNQFGFGVITPTERIDATGGNVKADNFISATTTYPDYVFETFYNGSSDLKEDYEFTTLEEIETFTKENNHLPGIKSHAEIKAEGMNVNLSELVIQSLEKIEELYLHTIAQQKEIEALKKELRALKK